MNQGYLLNDYVRDSEVDEIINEESSNYLIGLKQRLDGTKTLTEVMIETSKFLDKYNLDDKVREEILRICNSFDEKTDATTAKSYLIDYLSNYSNEKEDNYNESNSKVIDIKEEVIDDAERKLKEVGVDLVGDSSTIINSIDDKDDVLRISDNVDTVYDYIHDRNEIIGESDTPNTEISIDKIEDVVESSKDDILLDNVLDREEKNLENSRNIELTQDGAIEITTDINNYDSLNFAAMMTAGILVDNGLDLKDNLDMKLIKNKQDVNKYRIIYGNFPLTNHPENRLDPVIVSKIQGYANTYDSNADYMDYLSHLAPELKEALTLVNEHILDKTGAFQMAVKNNGTGNDMVFAMDDNYGNVMDTFNTNGAMVTIDAEEHGIVRINDDISGNQLSILSNVNETLTAEKYDSNEREKGGPQYSIGSYSENNNSEAANVNIPLLVIMSVAEILLLIGAYFIFLINQ